MMPVMESMVTVMIIAVATWVGVPGLKKTMAPVSMTVGFMSQQREEHVCEPSPFRGVGTAVAIMARLTLAEHL